MSDDVSDILTFLSDLPVVNSGMMVGEIVCCLTRSDTIIEEWRYILGFPTLSTTQETVDNITHFITSMEDENVKLSH